MRSQYTMVAVKIGIQGFGHGVRPFTWLAADVQGDRIASTRRKRAP